MTDRWERLFADLEAHLDEVDKLEREGDVAERTRAERANIRLVDRLAGSHGEIELVLRSGGRLRGHVVDVGAEWLVVTAPQRVLVPVDGIVSVSGLGRPGDGGSRRPTRRLSLAWALRALARDRATVRLTDILGVQVTGTIDIVGADVLDLVEHPPDLARRARHVTGTRSIRFSAVVSVESL